jgi:hypothetical protein
MSVIGAANLLLQSPEKNYYGFSEGTPPPSREHVCHREPESGLERVRMMLVNPMTREPHTGLRIGGAPVSKAARSCGAISAMWDRANGSGVGAKEIATEF